MKLKQEAKQSIQSKRMLRLSSRIEEEGTKIRYDVGAQVPSKIFSFLVLISANRPRNFTFIRYTTTCIYAITSCWLLKFKCNI